MTDTKACTFCSRLAAGDVGERLGSAASMLDAFPISRGHTLVIPSRHEGDLFNLSKDERREMWELVDVVQAQLEVIYRPDGFNIGVNAGAAAGQTIAHAHIHVVPRFTGDVGDPRGGVRWVIPEKAKYWA